MTISNLSTGLKPIPLIQQQLIYNLEHNLDIISDITQTFYEDDQRLVPEISAIYMDTNPSLDEQLIKQGLYFAIMNHIEQYRDSGHPATVHDFHVGYILAQWGLGDNGVLAGINHDILEDSTNRAVRSELVNLIYKNFGMEVLIGVMAQSKSLSSMFIEDLQEIDKEMYQKLHEFQTMYPNIEFLGYVRVADNISNLYTKKHMGPKHGMTPEQRIQKFCNTSRKHVLPIAREIDRSGTLEMRIAPYIQELIAR